MLYNCMMLQKDANNHIISKSINVQNILFSAKGESQRQRLSQEQLRVRELYTVRMQRAPFERRRKNHDWRPTMETPMGNISEKFAKKAKKQ
jgi:hypothetical protein